MIRINKSELLVDYCQNCGAELGSPECCRNRRRKDGSVSVADPKPITKSRRSLALRIVDGLNWKQVGPSYVINKDDVHGEIAARYHNIVTKESAVVLTGDVFTGYPGAPGIVNRGRHQYHVMSV